MALRVWLPLNGTLENKGISEITLSSGTPTYTNGKIGQCLNTGTLTFNLPANFINNISATKQYSICCWCKNLNASAAGRWVFMLGSGNGTSRGLWESNATAFRHWAYGGSGHNIPTSINTIDGNWHHIVFTVNNNIINLYVDGIYQGQNTATATGELGGNNTVQLNATNYNLNDFRIYDHCLSPKEVKEISQGLVLHYKLDGWSGGAGENLVEGSNTNTTSTNKWFGHSAVGGNTSTIEQDETGVYCVKVMRDTTEQSSWDYLSYDNLLRNNIKTNTKYTISFDCKPSVTGSIGFTGFVNGNATNYMTNSTTVIQGNCIANQWNHMVYQCTTISSFDNITVGGQVVYFSRSTSLKGTNVTVLFKNIKVEEGSIETSWSPTSSEMGIDTTKVTDSSGYGNDGNIVNATTENINLDGRYQVCTNFLGATVDTTSTTITGAQYLYASFPMPAWSSLTLAWWGNNIVYGRGGIFETTGTTGNIWEGSDYNTTAIANWDSTFGIYNGSSRVNIFSNFVKDGSWHYHVITFDGANVKYYCDSTLKQTSALTGTLPAITGFKIGLGRAGGVYRQIKQKISDFRIYTTSLSAEDVLDLYHTSANIDNEKRLHSFEFVEDDGNRVDEQGLVHSGLLSSDSDLIKLLYDKELHIEPDGSVWAHIYHHNRPDLGSFASTNDFANSVKIDDNRWFNATEIVNSFSSEWEFLIIYNFTQGGTVYKERWIQTKSPEIAVFGDVDAADITRVTGGEYKTGTWGGLYKKNGSAYWVMNNGTNGNWWGATGSFSIYQGGIPGYGGSITTTGCNDLYIRIDRFSSTPTHASIGRGSVYIFNDFIEK